MKDFTVPAFFLSFSDSLISRFFHNENMIGRFTSSSFYFLTFNWRYLCKWLSPRHILHYYLSSQIEDHRTELYAANPTGFPGQGYRLGKQSPVDNSLSTSSHKPSNVSQRSDCVGSSSKDNAWDSQNIPLLSLPTSRYYLTFHVVESINIQVLDYREKILYFGINGNIEGISRTVTHLFISFYIYVYFCKKSCLIICKFI